MHRRPGNALNGAQSFVLAHLAFLPLALSVSTWAHQLMKHRAESRFRTGRWKWWEAENAAKLLGLLVKQVFFVGGSGGSWQLAITDR